MTKSDLRVVKSLLAAAQEMNMETVREYTHPECEIIEPESLPFGGVYEGKDAFEDLFDDIWGLWESADYDPVDYLDAGDRVFVTWDSKLEAPETGETVETSLVEVYYVEDELVNRVEVYYKDTAKLLEILE